MGKKIKENYRRLPLEKVYNARDLGGYAGKGRLAFISLYEPIIYRKQPKKIRNF